MRAFVIVVVVDVDAVFLSFFLFLALKQGFPFPPARFSSEEQSFENLRSLPTIYRCPKLKLC